MGSEHDPKVEDKIVHILKTQGLFDQWRKDCLSFVDSRPAYEHLRDKVNTSVATFLSQQKWTPGLNKNQLREKLRNHILMENFFESGVTKIIDQIVTPKVYPTIKPQVEEIVYTVLGVKTSPQAEDTLKPKIVVQNNCDVLSSVSNLTADSVKSPLKESSVDSPTSTVYEQLSTNIAVQDFSESAHLPERQQSPPMNKPFDNFCNLREKLQQSDPLKPHDLLQQEPKKIDQDPKKSHQEWKKSDQEQSLLVREGKPNHTVLSVDTPSKFEDEMKGDEAAPGNSVELASDHPETASSEKKSDIQKGKADESAKKSKSSSSSHSSRSKDHRSHSKHPKSSRDKSDSSRSKGGSKESRPGRSEDSKGSSHRERSHSHHHRSNSCTHSHHQKDHNKCHHHHKGSHHSPKKSSGRESCREEFMKKQLYKSGDKDDGSGSAGDCGGAGGGSSMVGTGSNSSHTTDQGGTDQVEQSGSGNTNNSHTDSDVKKNRAKLPEELTKNYESSCHQSGDEMPLVINKTDSSEINNCANKLENLTRKANTFADGSLFTDCSTMLFCNTTHCESREIPPEKEILSDGDSNSHHALPKVVTGCESMNEASFYGFMKNEISEAKKRSQRYDILSYSKKQLRQLFSDIIVDKTNEFQKSDDSTELSGGVPRLFSQSYDDGDDSNESRRSADSLLKRHYISSTGHKILRTMGSQRYGVGELYKPRPSFGSSSSRRRQTQGCGRLNNKPSSIVLHG